jgi:hypothetical protein
MDYLLRALVSGCILALLACPAIAATEELRLYVAPGGSDSWSGIRPAANASGTDGPFRTLERARDEIRSMRKARRIHGPVTVLLRGGSYFRENSFLLTEEDSGSSARPVVFRPFEGEKAVLTGGRELSGFGPVTDEPVLARLQPAAHGHVLRADLRKQGIRDFGAMTARGFGRNIQPAALELFFQDKPMQLARWPNSEWALIAGAPDGKDGGKFTYEGDRPSGWKQTGDIWFHGYWGYDWADTYEKAASIDTEKREIVTVPPHGVYGYHPGKRFYALNILEELDEPGEWFLDRSSGVLYFWPPAPLSERKVSVSIAAEPLITVRGAAHIRIEGLTVECGRGCGVEIMGGRDVLVDRCLIRNLGTVGVSIGGLIGDIYGRLYNETTYAGDGGRNNGVRRSEIVNTGEGGVILGGGNRKTLTAAGNFVEDCRIHSFQRWARTYRPAVAIHGVGNRVAHNLLHDAPHSAIILNGNEHLIEFNEFHHVCMETGDAGAFYMGRDWSQRGNIVRFNYFHDLHGVEGQKGFTDVMAVYLDDWSSGTLVYGNVCRQAGRAVLVGGGRDNTIENNIFIDCRPAIHVDARGLGWAKYYFDGSNNTLFDRLKAVNHDKPPYSTKYPELARLLDDEPVMPKGNKIVRNICVGGKWLELQNGLTDKVILIQDNVVEAAPGFRDMDANDFRPKPGSPAHSAGFKPIPFKEIGPR